MQYYIYNDGQQQYLVQAMPQPQQQPQPPGTSSANLEAKEGMGAEQPSPSAKQNAQSPQPQPVWQYPQHMLYQAQPQQQYVVMSPGGGQYL